MRQRALLCLLLGLLAACAPQTGPAIVPPVSLSPAPEETAAPVVLPSATATLIPTAQPSPTQPLPSATPIPFAVCSPLEGISLAELGLPDLLKNPFELPRPGMDEGHHGADFAYWSRGERNTMQGHPIQSVLNGRVAAVLENRQPYGYAVIIETPLDALPTGWLTALEIPALQPTVPAAPNLLCPPDGVDYGAPETRALYLLYAHLDQPSPLAVGQPVTCGQPVGMVGTTGRSVNHHLHLEARIGPAGASIPAMAHYETSASPEEMSAYCTWRVSGLFALFDPMRLFTPAPAP